MNSCRMLLLLLLAAAWPHVARAQAPVIVTVCDEKGEDHDADGLSTSCETELARSFAPRLVVAPGGCNWDGAAARTGGGYFFGAQPSDSTVRVVYLPAYFRDCGWHGVKCWLPQVDCAPHDGDSEFIAIDLTPRGDGAWSVTGVFLSAHCFGRYDKACRWYRGAELKKIRFEGASPLIWVAEGRNANYASARDCDRGLHAIDTCDRNTAVYTFPILANRNIGSRAAPISGDGCVAGRLLETPLAAPGAIECFWKADQPFRGWQSGAEGVTPYFRYLTGIAGF